MFKPFNFYATNKSLKNAPNKSLKNAPYLSTI